MSADSHSSQQNAIIDEIKKRVLETDALRHGTKHPEEIEMPLDYIEALDEITKLDREEIEEIARDVIAKHKNITRTVVPQKRQKTKERGLTEWLINISFLLVIGVTIKVLFLNDDAPRDPNEKSLLAKIALFDYAGLSASISDSFNSTLATIDAYVPDMPDMDKVIDDTLALFESPAIADDNVEQRVTSAKEISAPQDLTNTETTESEVANTYIHKEVIVNPETATIEIANIEPIKQREIKDTVVEAIKPQAEVISVEALAPETLASETLVATATSANESADKSDNVSEIKSAAAADEPLPVNTVIAKNTLVKAEPTIEPTLTSKVDALNSALDKPVTEATDVAIAKAELPQKQIVKSLVEGLDNAAKAKQVLQVKTDVKPVDAIAADSSVTDIAIAKSALPESDIIDNTIVATDTLVTDALVDEKPTVQIAKVTSKNEALPLETTPEATSEPAAILTKVETVEVDKAELLTVNTMATKPISTEVPQENAVEPAVEVTELTVANTDKSNANDLDNSNTLQADTTQPETEVVVLKSINKSQSADGTGEGLVAHSDQVAQVIKQLNNKQRAEDTLAVTDSVTKTDKASLIAAKAVDTTLDKTSDTTDKLASITEQNDSIVAEDAAKVQPLQVAVTGAKTAETKESAEIKIAEAKTILAKETPAPAESEIDIFDSFKQSLFAMFADDEPQTVAKTEAAATTAKTQMTNDSVPKTDDKTLSEKQASQQLANTAPAKVADAVIAKVKGNKLGTASQVTEDNNLSNETLAIETAAGSNEVLTSTNIAADASSDTPTINVIASNNTSGLANLNAKSTLNAEAKVTKDDSATDKKDANQVNTVKSKATENTAEKPKAEADLTTSVINTTAEADKSVAEPVIKSTEVKSAVIKSAEVKSAEAKNADVNDPVTESRAEKSKVEQQVTVEQKAPAKPAYKGLNLTLQLNSIVDLSQLAQINVVDFYQLEKRLPLPKDDIDLSVDMLTAHPLITNVQLSPQSTVIVTLAQPFGDNKQLTFTPKATENATNLTWQCSTNLDSAMLNGERKVACNGISTQ